MTRSGRWLPLLLALTCTASLAAPMSFGSRSVEVPAPERYVSLAASVPKFIEIAQGFLPASNRLVEVYTVPADRDELLKGKAVNVSRQFQLQVPRSMEGKLISQKEFSEASGEMEEGLRKSMGDASKQAADLSAAGTSNLKKTTGVDAGVSMTDIGFQGVYRKEDWGMFFTITTKVATRIGNDNSSDTMVVAGALVLANHQLLYLYDYASLRGPADTQWAKDSLSTWADAIHAANPDDPAIEAQAQRERGGFDFKQVGMMAFFGGLIGLIVYMVRGKRN
jgi:hypothetical protein